MIQVGRRICMLCDKCKKREAKIYYTEIVDGEKREQHLCEECASEYTKFQIKSALGNKDMSLGGIFSSILDNYYNSPVVKEETTKPVMQCEVCGMTYETFVQEGRFGCANCYTKFGKQLEKNFRQIQGAASHIGKKPKGFISDTDRIINDLTEVDRLSIQLQDAVEKEEFEEAARIRDQIKELRKKEESRNA